MGSGQRAGTLADHARRGQARVEVEPADHGVAPMGVRGRITTNERSPRSQTST